MEKNLTEILAIDATRWTIANKKNGKSWVIFDSWDANPPTENQVLARVSEEGTTCIFKSYLKEQYQDAIVLHPNETDTDKFDRMLKSYDNLVTTQSEAFKELLNGTASLVKAQESPMRQIKEMGDSLQSNFKASLEVQAKQLEIRLEELRNQREEDIKVVSDISEFKMEIEKLRESQSIGTTLLQIWASDPKKAEQMAEGALSVGFTLYEKVAERFRLAKGK